MFSVSQFRQWFGDAGQLAEAHRSAEDAISKVVPLGGDTDNQDCIASGISEAFYGRVPAGYERWL